MLEKCCKNVADVYTGLNGRWCVVWAQASRVCTALEPTWRPSSLGMFVGPHHNSPSFSIEGRAQELSTVKNEYLLLALEEKIAGQALSIVGAFRRLKKSKSREMSARSYALLIVCPQLCFFKEGELP